jgi:formate hydrogenlyase transcriptional activator
MINKIPALAWSCLPDGTTEFLNERWLAYTGLSKEEACGWGWKTPIHPDDLTKLMETWLRLFATGEPGEEEARIRRFDGEYRWFLIRSEPVYDEHHEIVRWFGTNTDIEDLKRAEFVLTSEKEILKMIASRASLEEILAALCNCLDAQIPGMISSVLVIDSDGVSFTTVAGPHVPRDWNENVKPTANPLVAGADRQQRVIVSDIASDPSWTAVREIALRNGLRAAWSLPIVSKDQKVLGSICIYYSKPQTPRAGEIKLVERVSHVGLIAVERVRAESALTTAHEEIRVSEAKRRWEEDNWRRIVDLIPQFVVVLAADGSPLYGNRAALDYMGVDQNEISRVGFGGPLSHPEDVERVREVRKSSLDRGVPFELEQRMPGKDGIYHWFLFLYRPYRDQHENVVRWYVAWTNIDERKQAEEKIKNENLALRDEIVRASMFEEIVGTSPALQAVLCLVHRVGETDSTVLITGETGTGKELIARAIHQSSPRASRAFVSVNCAALAPSLISSELFGHEKGAFTGALQRRLGRFELADGGTIFLDEVGELPADTQIALLRVLQEREIERVGGTKSIPVDVRVLAATNRDLTVATASGAFRSDLFYRLNVFPIDVPPLRERKEDIVMLLEYFVGRYARKFGKSFQGIDKRTLDLFQSYDWPGNIRELQNVVERSVILSSGGSFHVDKGWLLKESRPGPSDLKQGSNHSEPGSDEKNLIEVALRESKGKVSGPGGAAAKLGIPPSTLESKIKTLGIQKSRFKFR